MNRSLILLFLLLSLSLLMLSCGTDNEPDSLIPEEQYIDIYVDLVLVNQLSDKQVEEASKDSLRDVVYSLHGVDQDQFKRSHEFYQRQADQQIQRIEKMEEHLTQFRDSLRDQLDRNEESSRNSSAVPDTIDM